MVAERLLAVVKLDTLGRHEVDSQDPSLAGNLDPADILDCMEWTWCLLRPAMLQQSNVVVLEFDKMPVNSIHFPG